MTRNARAKTTVDRRAPKHPQMWTDGARKRVVGGYFHGFHEDALEEIEIDIPDALGRGPRAGLLNTVTNRINEGE